MVEVVHVNNSMVSSVVYVLCNKIKTSTFETYNIAFPLTTLGNCNSSKVTYGFDPLKLDFNN